MEISFFRFHREFAEDRQHKFQAVKISSPILKIITLVFIFIISSVPICILIKTSISYGKIKQTGKQILSPALTPISSRFAKWGVLP